MAYLDSFFVRGTRSPEALRRTLLLLAIVPIVTGTMTVLGGSNIVPEGGSPSASVESELRFFAVWWIGAGLVLAWIAGDVLQRGRELRVLCVLLFLGGIARALALLDAGSPAPLFVVLMVVELVLPVVLVLWQKRVARNRVTQ